MIRYALKCQNKHGFESWFKSAEAFEALRNSGMIACPECHDTNVEKSLMAPLVRTGREKSQVSAPRQPVTNDVDPDLAEAIRTIREHVEKNSD